MSSPNSPDLDPELAAGLLESLTSWDPRASGDRTFKLSSGTTSEPGRYVKSLGEPRRGTGVVCGAWGALWDSVGRSPAGR